MTSNIHENASLESDEPSATDVTKGSGFASDKCDLDSKRDDSCPQNASAAITSHLAHDPEEACRFLELTHAGRGRFLVAIHPETCRIEARKLSHNLDLPAWLHGHADWNIYFTVNDPHSVFPGTKKCSKDDIHVARFLHVDVDPRAGEDLEKERERILLRLTEHLPADVCPPSFIIDSGGGYQALWLLREPHVVNGEDGCAVVENRCRWLERRLGGDNCHNVDRVLRMPGTVNWPNAKKRSRGRAPTMAKLVSSHPERAYALEDFQTVSKQSRAAPSLGRAAVSALPRIASVDELPETVPDRIKVIIVQGHHPDEGSKEGDDSRSAWLFDCVCGLARAGCDDEKILAIITDPEFAISASVLDKGTKASAYALRQIERAREIVASDLPNVGGSEHVRWAAMRVAKGTGELVPLPTYENTRIAIRALGAETRHDVFHDRKLLGGHAIAQHCGELSDDACLFLRSMIFDAFGWEPKKEHVLDAALSLCLEGRFDPIRDYLDGLAWDGVPRLDAWAVTCLGAEDCALNRAIGRKTLIAAVRRVRQPGCKFDYVPVLEGPQGCGKSTAVRILAGDDNFSDKGILHLEDRAQQEAVKGVWLYELAELAGLGKKDVNRVKAFVTQQEDRGRAAYGRFVRSEPRRCIFIGTTNDSEYLIDPTGNRRFWPMAVAQVDSHALRRDRDQLWAEAAAAERENEALVIPEHLWAALEDRQRERMQGGDWAELLGSLKPSIVGNEERLTAAECYQKLEIPAAQLRDYRIGAALERAMASLGYARRKLRADGRSVWGYVRKVKQPELLL